MKVKSTFLYLIFISLGLFLMNNADGPASVQGQDRTGSPLSSGSCNTTGCHDSGAFNPSVSIEVLSGTTSISGYEPGETYNVRITVNAADGVPDGYGFQTVALDANNDNGGDWTFFPNGGQQIVEFASGIQYTEHSGLSTSNVFTTSTWNAPAAGSGDVTFYVGAIASDGDGTKAGDGGAVNSITLTEGFMVSSNDIKHTIDFSVFPNPAQDFVNVTISSNSVGHAQLNVLDMTGKVISSNKFGIHQGQNVQRVDFDNLNSGLYLINLVSNDQILSKKFLKL